ncbi:hypothetical protein HNY73_011353 [Argiope bruennichi]|uniref:Uncharacterized protein n=1 Tax=Argiope bruennichi TaxID=94029 RepID=A0A8T0FA74_ARGBR|nr:hypothetical protein HNY73_011353 [Argiope bruennichi]
MLDISQSPHGSDGYSEVRETFALHFLTKIVIDITFGVTKPTFASMAGPLEHILELSEVGNLFLADAMCVYTDRNVGR